MSSVVQMLVAGANSYLASGSHFPIIVFRLQSLDKTHSVVRNLASDEEELRNQRLGAGKRLRFHLRIIFHDMFTGRYKVLLRLANESTSLVQAARMRPLPIAMKFSQRNFAYSSCSLR
jgi:hypothetical protein